MQARLANPNDRDYFIKDYLKRYGQDKELAEKHATVCTEIDRSIVLHKEDEIIGSVTWSIREGIEAGLVVIFQMSIAKKEHRGKGYGSQLVKKCLEDIENFYIAKNFHLRRIFITINETNLPGRNIYKKHGFYILTDLKDHRVVGEKEFVYAKDYF
ncbi:GNAT family N-acetyltransferase [Alkaliphilus hydrothermalis]|uniref:RimJ/RimL family protein N-acetyltransferase n=1 Tax=Alkaliphilus hydrothermalis TaxID=1482730 RepID=A0ABS2NTL0_9FIRM|nr:GNAT family N-acetyltransferase [Alkaliphilus hydrothermalis]MBM7616282.1 RimJ/RimL family protein N-acetyltransferase [Alkaliphilus hydrothermalis]